MKWKCLALCLLTIGMFETVAEAQRRKNSRVRGQSEFSAEDTSVRRPVSLPKDALEILRKEVLQYGKDEDQTPDELATESFLASEIHLDGPNEIALIVMGEGRLRGANVISFWVFRKSPQGYELILDVAAHDLTVKRTRWKGYRIIETAKLTSSIGTIATFRFDGKRYRLYKTKSQPIG
jgi:hypothetical protein